MAEPHQPKRVITICRSLTNVGDTIKRPPLRIPDIENEDEVPEIKRLMKRKIPSLPPEGVDYTCAICYACDDEHFFEDCPWLKKIPPGKVVGPAFDEACLDCGKIGGRVGPLCCSKGSYAVPKWCWFCGQRGHWHWEDRCYDDFRLDPELAEFWLPIKNSFKKEEEEEEKKAASEQPCWTCKYCGKDNKEEEDQETQHSVISIRNYF